MSGTSLDGIDTVICQFNNNHSSGFSLIEAQTYPIPEALKIELSQLSQSQQNNELDLYAQLDVKMGRLFADACNKVLKKAHMNADQIKAIGSHGQTIRHYPKDEYPTSIQIGDANIIAQNTGITTIADFRRRDMAAGGQGAPLVPPFHHALFGNINSNNKVILNIGGIANITVLTHNNSPIIGYDTGPGNGLMDDFCRQHFHCNFDNNGQLAEKGSINQEFLQLLLHDPFFSLVAPKSTGREYFSANWLENKLKLFKTRLAEEDIIASLLELTCVTITQQIKLLDVGINELLLCGGGAHNQQLRVRLKHLLPTITITTTEQYGLHPDWVEASAFAWLAQQTLLGLYGNLPSVTGAKSSVILGAIWPA